MIVVPTGIYQLCALQVRSDAANMDIDKFSQITSIQERLLSEKKTGKLMGVFTTQIGDCDTGLYKRSNCTHHEATETFDW